MSFRPIKSESRAMPTMEGAGVHLYRVFGFGDPAESDPFRADGWWRASADNVERTAAAGIAPVVSGRWAAAGATRAAKRMESEAGRTMDVRG